MGDKKKVGSFSAGTTPFVAPAGFGSSSSSFDSFSAGTKPFVAPSGFGSSSSSFDSFSAGTKPFVAPAGFGSSSSSFGATPSFGSFSAGTKPLPPSGFGSSSSSFGAGTTPFVARSNARSDYAHTFQPEPEAAWGQTRPVISARREDMRLRRDGYTPSETRLSRANGVFVNPESAGGFFTSNLSPSAKKAFESFTSPPKKGGKKSRKCRKSRKSRKSRKCRK